jgi:hypothetical protein
MNIKKEETVEISVRVLDRLRQRDIWLSCLEQAGLDSWEGVDEAHIIFEEEIE